MTYRSRLDGGWDLGVVKSVARGLVGELGHDGAVGWLDDGSEHPHRIALTVRADLAKQLVDALKMRLEDNGVEVWLT